MFKIGALTSTVQDYSSPDLNLWLLRIVHHGVGSLKEHRCSGISMENDTIGGRLSHLALLLWSWCGNWCVRFRWLQRTLVGWANTNMVSALAVMTLELG